MFCALALMLAVATHAAQAQDLTGTTVPTEVFRLVNAERSKAGMKPLDPAPRLSTAARGHAADLARTGGLSHTGSDGSDMAQRARRQGYKFCLVAENVARGHPDAAAVVDAWMKSPPHKANILRDRVVHFGAARGPGLVWVLMVARPC